MDYDLLVNEAFKQYQSVLALSRSPLAASDLVTPALVLDDVTPTAEERGRGLRIVLQWAVAQLAPAAPPHPLGASRPLDDPTWRDPRWWRYNILRHRYLEPLHPDDFVEGGRFTETLLALTGIPSPDVFFGERNRGVRMVAELLARQEAGRMSADDELRRLAVAAACQPLAAQPAAHKLLTIAALFDDVFPRDLLLALAASEGISAAPTALAWLVEQRYLLAGDAGAQLWLGPALRAHFRAEQPAADLRRRHVRVAEDLARRGELLAAAHHYQAAEHWAAAADLILQIAAQPGGEWTPAQLRPLLAAFPASQPDAARRRRLHPLRADTHAALGEIDAAIAAARAGLADAPTVSVHGWSCSGGWASSTRSATRCTRSPTTARPRRLLAPDDPALPVLLKDRGWLHILQRDWGQAEADLTRMGWRWCAAVSPRCAPTCWMRWPACAATEREFAAAIACAQEALALREASGDLLAVAKSLGNLGLLYTGAGAYAEAVAAHREAMATYRRLGHQEMVATAWLNIGMAQHLAGDRDGGAGRLPGVPGAEPGDQPAAGRGQGALQPGRSQRRVGAVRCGRPVLAAGHGCGAAPSLRRPGALFSWSWRRLYPQLNGSTTAAAATATLPAISHAHARQQRRSALRCGAHGGAGATARVR
jgi:tetratricopeptide (TPR) repeat protein